MAKNFLHKPNIGDVLYGLPVIRHLGGGTLYLDSSLMPPYRAAFVCALSFLRRQPYLQERRLHDGQDFDIDRSGDSLRRSAVTPGTGGTTTFIWDGTDVLEEKNT